MQQYQDILLRILTDVDSAVCVLGSIMLFIRGKVNRARRMLAYTLLLWGLCSIARTIVLEAGMLPLLLHPFRPVGLIGANLFVLLMILFPLEVMLPGWLNGKRQIMLTLPAIVLTIIYIVGLSLLGQNVEEFDTFSEFISSFGNFNVWFRLTFLLLVILYNAGMLMMVYKNEKKYIRWKNENFADDEYTDISWMRFYAIGSIAIFATWILNVFMACTWNFILNTVVLIVTFSYYIYKGLFHESAYPEDFFKYVNDNPLNPSLPLQEQEVFTEECKSESCEELENASFEDKMPQYVETFKDWMDREKPYLYKDFKLTDVSRVLPLNRSYLSRVLNEGLGMNFCQVVRKYRVEASKHLLKDEPDLPIYMVAEQCGFSSDTSFIRSFQQETGISPSRFRTEA